MNRTASVTFDVDRTVIHWFRRDLRITDNTALAAAARDAEVVAPVYVLSTWKDEHAWAGPHRQEFLCGCLASLAGNLSSIGSRLIIRSGDAVQELLALAKEIGATAIYANQDPDPFGRSVETRLQKAAQEAGVEVRLFKDVCVHERDEVLTASGESYRVFTPYSKAWRKVGRSKAGGRLRKLASPPDSKSLDLPGLEYWNLQSEGQIIEPGEKAARQRLSSFLAAGIETYGDKRNLLDDQSTSRLSQDLRWGLLSIREVFDRCEERAETLEPKGRKSVESFTNELIWREFYMQILWHWPEVLESDFSEKYRDISWPGDDKAFDRWCNGETGFPIVDAAMRQLWQTGFMHNRARMITAMFLTKDLHVHWKRGERFFMQQLTDGEIASNNGGWQWSAGTGADAAPYFRIQNPWTQTKRFDPSGDFIRQWLPELRDVPTQAFFAPPADGTPLAKGYPLPMVDHAAERDLALELFKAELS